MDSPSTLCYYSHHPSPVPIFGALPAGYILGKDKARRGEIILGDQEASHLVFLPSKAEAETFCSVLQATVTDRRVEVSHNDHTQAERTEVHRWIHGHSDGVLVACKLYDSGVNIPDLPHIVFVGCALSLATYMSASSRTGRKGHSGNVHTIFSPQAWGCSSHVVRAKHPGICQKPDINDAALR